MLALAAGGPGGVCGERPEGKEGRLVVPLARDAARRALHLQSVAAQLVVAPGSPVGGGRASPNAYGHPFRPLGIVFHPIGVALDWAVVRPLYWLGGLAPEWFGMTADDAWVYHSHMPELTISKDAPRYRWE